MTYKQMSKDKDHRRCQVSASALIETKPLILLLAFSFSGFFCIPHHAPAKSVGSQLCAPAANSRWFLGVLTQILTILWQVLHPLGHFPNEGFQFYHLV